MVIKTILISVLFFLIGAAITYGMITLWLKIIGSPIWQKILIVLTLVFAAKFLLGNTQWMIAKLKEARSKTA